MEKFLTIMLAVHIAGGTTALLSGLVALLTAKGGKAHRLAGKFYFGGMTAVFLGAVVVAIGHQNHFLLMVGFFSYYLTVRGYRVLRLKNLHNGQRATAVDWLIVALSAVFLVALLAWGGYVLAHGTMMGVVALVFGTIGCATVALDIRKFRTPPTDKMHWWYGHINGMGGSYISAVTAFVVVNIQLPQFQWVLWILPSLVGGMLISRTIRFYRTKFAARP
ncbi:MAG: hypothetical protein MUC38_05145 [Cyclobacteriaceae bacterium]|nr:hypothetical protein [Cyclobacteriaceae bacterium]